MRQGIVAPLEGFKALFEVEQPVQGVAARINVESPNGPTVVDLQEFNKSLRLGDVGTHPNTRVHPETIAEILHVLIDRTN